MNVPATPTTVAAPSGETGQADEDEARLAFHLTGWSVFVLWNLMTLVGALAGTAIGDPKTFGLDAAVGGAFLALLWPRLTAWPQRLVALVGAAAATGLVPLTAAGLPIVIGGAAAVLVGLVVERRRPVEEVAP